MDRLRVRRGLAAAFSFLCLCLSPAQADVKLRIYLQDGSLQSGNLITESADTFVILNKEGARIEIPRKNIMFINGKTLKQWEERPDKLFQTEIMPSDVPDPSFVNNKAALPHVPEAKALPPVPKAAPVVAPVAKMAEKKAEPTPEPKPTPTPTPVKEVRQEKPVEKTTEKPAAKPAAKPVVETVKKPAAAPVASATPSPSPSVSAAPVAEKKMGKRFQERAAKGARHREKAFELMAQGEQGQAQQNFLIARLLEPDHGETYLALARMSRDEGLYDSALKYYGHWTLRKSKDAATESVAVKQMIEVKKKQRLYLQITGVAGGMSWIPVVLLMRRFRRRKPAARVEEAVAVAAGVVETPAVDAPAWVAEVEAAFEPVVEPAPPPPPIMKKPPVAPPPPTAPPPAPVRPPEPVLLPEPVEEEFLAPLPIEETLLPVEPIVVPEPIEEPLPAPAPVEAPAPILLPAPLAPAFAGPAPDPSEILSMARSVENALVRANAAAADGRADEARRSYRTALVLNADCATAHLGLGYLSFAEEKWDTALLHYRKALEIDPSSADAHYGVARVLLEINRVEDAIPELRATLTLDPTHADAQDALTTLGKPA